jgi:hypothetical protein
MDEKKIEEILRSLEPAKRKEFCALLMLSTLQALSSQLEELSRILESYATAIEKPTNLDELFTEEDRRLLREMSDACN